MKKNDKTALIIFIMTMTLVLYYFLFPNRNWQGKPYLETTQNNSFAVVELFTSEGCSSCPPADALMAKIQEESGNKNIYFLAFHVDYWDHLNWKDSFSNAQFTNRQQQYADWMGQNVLYTPQFVINGTSEFAGDDARSIYSRISNALQTRPDVVLELQAQPKNDSLEITYKTSTITESSSLFVAAVQKTAVTKVARGENGGRLLHHVQIVRRAITIPLVTKEGHLTIEKPEGFHAKDWELLGFVQKNTTGGIVAATKAVFR